MERKDIMKTVVRQLESIVKENGSFDGEIKINEQTKLIGKNAVLESIGLVTLIADIEEILDDEFGYMINIADEKAMSREKSPFIDVKSLTDYIGELIGEKQTYG